ncbi:MAG: DUF1294 domain-containing protein [Clostridiales bacterium]|nr:DUF1294 domain-containing protein [Clostridiales bacterium]
MEGLFICLYLIVMNVMTFIVYGIDKQKAKRGKWRISEKTLMMLAVFGGSIGAWIGMQVFRHKTKHLLFVIGVPLIFFVELGIVIYFILMSYHIIG